VTEGKAGDPWSAFTARIAALPEGQAWRHNQAGDLPGAGDRIDTRKLAALVDANRGRRGWSYTHKPPSARNAEAISHANANGFTINLSADTLTEADQLAALNIGPVVVVLDAPEGAKADTVTPEGRRVVTCPATYRDDLRCSDCLLCARANRETIVGFPAHGTYRKAAAAVARGKNADLITTDFITPAPRLAGRANRRQLTGGPGHARRSAGQIGVMLAARGGSALIRVR
jgi:hypothetical protein